jgi:simple sugar transport system permease protein
MNEVHSIFDPTLLNSTLRSVSPILLAALGGLLCARVGVFNVALEGMMLVGAFFAVVGSYYSGSAIAGVAAGVGAGMVLATILAVLAVSLRGNEVVLGIALNLLATGLTAFLIRAIFGVQGLFQSDQIKGISAISLGPIARVPLLGPMLNGQIWIVYASWVLVVVTYLLLFRTPLGLHMRGVGEQPQAAASLGVSAAHLQYLALVLSGALCGLAGSQLSLGDVQLFSQNMSAGRGWIAVVAVMLGQAHPFGVLGASVLFGLADAIGFRLQGLDMPSELTATIPYIATLVALGAVQLRRRRTFGEAT